MNYIERLQKEVRALKKENRKIKDWLIVWVINKEKGEDWRRLMLKELGITPSKSKEKGQ